MQNTAKKIKKAMDSGVQPEAADAAAEGTPAKGKVGRKRKEKPVVESEGEGGEEAAEEETPKKKVKGAKKSKAKKAAASAADDESEEAVVKAEEVDE